MSSKYRVQFADPKSVIVQGADLTGVIAHGSTVPSDGTSGYSAGCVFVKSGGTGNKVIYVNNGTSASCAFKPVPSVGPVAVTAALTTITSTAPGAADYAIQNLVNTSAYGFVSQDEGNTVLAVIANLQTKVAEFETILRNANLIT